MWFINTPFTHFSGSLRSCRWWWTTSYEDTGCTMRVAQVCDIILAQCAWKQGSAAGAEGATNNRAAAPAVATMLALLVYRGKLVSIESVHAAALRGSDALFACSYVFVRKWACASVFLFMFVRNMYAAVWIYYFVSVYACEWSPAMFPVCFLKDKILQQNR